MAASDIMYAGGNPNFNEAAGQGQYNVPIGGEPTMYAGGSQNFNEAAGALPAWYQQLLANGTLSNTDQRLHSDLVNQNITEQQLNSLVGRNYGPIQSETTQYQGPADAGMLDQTQHYVDTDLFGRRAVQARYGMTDEGLQGDLEGYQLMINNQGGAGADSRGGLMFDAQGNVLSNQADAPRSKYGALNRAVIGGLAGYAAGAAYGGGAAAGAGGGGTAAGGTAAAGSNTAAGSVVGGNMAANSTGALAPGAMGGSVSVGAPIAANGAGTTATALGGGTAATTAGGSALGGAGSSGAMAGGTAGTGALGTAAQYIADNPSTVGALVGAVGGGISGAQDRTQASTSTTETAANQRALDFYDASRDSILDYGNGASTGSAAAPASFGYDAAGGAGGYTAAAGQSGYTAAPTTGGYSAATNEYADANNPHLQGTIDAANRGTIRNYNQLVAPKYSQGSSFGNSGLGFLEVNERANVNQQLADTASGLSYQGYQQAANLAESGAQRQDNASQFTQNLIEQGAGRRDTAAQYAGNWAEAAAGRQDTAAQYAGNWAESAAARQDNAAQFAGNQQLQHRQLSLNDMRDRIAALQSGLSGATGLGGTTTTTNSSTTPGDAWGGAIGGAIVGSQVGGRLGGQSTVPAGQPASSSRNGAGVFNSNDIFGTGQA